MVFIRECHKFERVIKAKTISETTTLWNRCLEALEWRMGKIDWKLVERDMLRSFGISSRDNETDLASLSLCFVDFIMDITATLSCSFFSKL